ncbi:hypothetical protein SH501x_001420 [Pirellulaceae bacterium SH501]
MQLTDDLELSPELKRAEVLSSKLHKAAGAAGRYGQKKALHDVEDAEELVQLLEDSLRLAMELIANPKRN